MLLRGLGWRAVRHLCVGCLRQVRLWILVVLDVLVQHLHSFLLLSVLLLGNLDVLLDLVLFCFDDELVEELHESLFLLVLLLPFEDLLLRDVLNLLAGQKVLEAFLLEQDIAL